ncbi:BRO-N domain-containing protein [Acetobacter nitrogenifigens]|uniref:BRO-N domain-containing protein n=1 Tax=Acetobacter nitrogenifigens TaxID=285268 RepID=UPI00222F3314|nr:Bro-N domain-containing protein [Acetobacter nitrogenifigens]
MERGGEPWWVLADVCAVLEHRNPTMVASRLDDDERITLNISEGNRGNPHAIAINESGLWSLVLTSRKPQAKRFKKWITSEVIPSIRKTGGYIAANSGLRRLTDAHPPIFREHLFEPLACGQQISRLKPFFE